MFRSNEKPMNKRTVNFVQLLSNNPLTDLIVDCWSRDLTYFEFKEFIETRNDLQRYYYSKEMFDLIFKLLDEQYDCDTNLYCNGV